MFFTVLKLTRAISFIQVHRRAEEAAATMIWEDDDDDADAGEITDDNENEGEAL